MGVTAGTCSPSLYQEQMNRAAGVTKSQPCQVTWNRAKSRDLKHVYRAKSRDISRGYRLEGCVGGMGCKAGSAPGVAGVLSIFQSHYRFHLSLLFLLFPNSNTLSVISTLTILSNSCQLLYKTQDTIIINEPIYNGSLHTWFQFTRWLALNTMPHINLFSPCDHPSIMEYCQW